MFGCVSRRVLGPLVLLEFYVQQGRGGDEFFYFCIWLAGTSEKVDARTCCLQSKVGSTVGGKRDLAPVIAEFSACPPFAPALFYLNSEVVFTPIAGATLVCRASIFAIVCSVLKCSFALGVRGKRDSWVAAFVATWVAPVPCQPPAGRHRDIPEQSII